MGHTYYSVYEHIAFSTKHRAKTLDPGIQPELFAYLAGAIKNQECYALIVGGHLEHVHLLVRKSNTILTGQLVKEIKRTSSRWMKSKRPELRSFHWQSGYGAFSVSYSLLNGVKKYILQQAEHHKKMTWEEEFRRLLKKHGIQFDERFYLD